ncbi:hypothetical protein BCO71033_01439 [Burkholderia contaminans]|uniref:Uncharacterized protein n=1 Tax=Burkholderia contaminans TaxID=488447 RepID=A0A6P2WDW0_9BURK|nr:hypothetical protein BCO71033_01439 [Burkholderia contaminans]
MARRQSNAATRQPPDNLDATSTPHTFDAHRCHQTADRAPRDLHAVAQQRMPDLAHADYAIVLVPNRRDEGLQCNTLKVHDALCFRWQIGTRVTIVGQWHFVACNDSGVTALVAQVIHDL